MKLYLVRHAEAAPGQPDELRPLTARGREQARTLGAQLRSEGVRPGIVYASPLLRARQTASLIAAELGVEAEVVEELAPGATAEGVCRMAREAGDSATVVAVGHQPDCSKIAAALTGAPEPPFPPAASVLIALAD